MQGFETKFNFLVAAISDTQEIIKFIDTKVAFATIAIGGMVTVLFSDTRSICQNYCSLACAAKILLWITVVGIILSIYCLANVIFPITKSYCAKITPRFYLGSNRKEKKRFILFSNKIDIIPTIENYQEQIANADEIQIIKSLTCELYTVSYIREVKTQRLNNLLIILTMTAVAFILTYVLIK